MQCLELSLLTRREWKRERNREGFNLSTGVPPFPPVLLPVSAVSSSPGEALFSWVIAAVWLGPPGRGIDSLTESDMQTHLLALSLCVCVRGAGRVLSPRCVDAVALDNRSHSPSALGPTEWKNPCSPKHIPLSPILFFSFLSYLVSLKGPYKNLKL